MNTSIQSWGNSEAVRIPKALLNQLSWEKNQQVVLEVVDKSLVIKKADRKKTLRERYEEFYGCAYEDIDFSKESEMDMEEFDWGEPVGGEAW